MIKRSHDAIRHSLLITGNALAILRKIQNESVQCVITSPPYWGLRDYGIKGQLGHEKTLQLFLNNLSSVFDEIKRILCKDGTLWLNIGDTYTSGNRGYRAHDNKNRARGMKVRPNTPDGLKPKDLLGIPWRVAFALQSKGWYLRSDIIWHKPNAMPESVKDRPTKAHEYLFLFSKSKKYYYNHKAILEGNGRNKRSVWCVKTKPFNGAHFATFPKKLIEPCIIASSKKGDYVLDPFCGSGTVGVACIEHNRKFIGIDLNPKYIKIAEKRIDQMISTCNDNSSKGRTIKKKKERKQGGCSKQCKLQD